MTGRRLACLLLALAACKTTAKEETPEKHQPSAEASAAPSATAAPASTSTFDEKVLASLAPGTLGGQVLDKAGKPLRDAVVFVKDGLPAAKYPPPDKPALVNQRDKTFLPRVLPVLVGTKVEFSNADQVLHNVYSRSRVKTFDLGTFAKSEARSTGFDEPGRVDVFCAIHTNMHAVILVMENPHFASTDARGVFEIKGVPPGSYGVRIWSERSEEQELRVDVLPDRPAVVRFKQK